MKIALLLEELGLPYEAHPVDTRKGEQFAPAYLQINPNGKVPALVDGDAVVFDSNAILCTWPIKPSNSHRTLPMQCSAAACCPG
jgi:glutathione S-transferase